MKNENCVVSATGEVLHRSKNLRAMLRYADWKEGRGVKQVDARKRNGYENDPAGVLTVLYRNGATCTAAFASYNIMVDFVRKRRSWVRAAITYHDGDMGYLTKPGTIAGN